MSFLDEFATPLWGNTADRYPHGFFSHPPSYYYYPIPQPQYRPWYEDISYPEFKRFLEAWLAELGRTRSNASYFLSTTYNSVPQQNVHPIQNNGFYFDVHKVDDLFQEEFMKRMFLGKIPLSSSAQTQNRATRLPVQAVYKQPLNNARLGR